MDQNLLLFLKRLPVFAQQLDWTVVTLTKIKYVKTELPLDRAANLAARREHLSSWCQYASLKPADSNLSYNFSLIKLNVNHITSLISYNTLIMDNTLTLLVLLSRVPKIVYLDFNYSENLQITITKPVGHSILPVYRSKKTLTESAIEKQDKITEYS